MKLMPLIPHPSLSNSLTGPYKVQAGAKVSTAQIELRFRIEAKTAEAFSKIIIPAAELKPKRKEELWKTTCFECFIPGRGLSAYLEFNGSPSGDWNWYSFENYRANMTPVPLTSRLEPKAVSMSKSAKEIEMSWVLPMSGAVQGFATHGESTSRFDPLGLTVVLQTEAGSSHWALSHESPQPDFHTRASFRYDPVRN